LGNAAAPDLGHTLTACHPKLPGQEDDSKTKANTVTHAVLVTQLCFW
jgi:hypothetical protein